MFPVVSFHLSTVCLASVEIYFRFGESAQLALVDYIRYHRCKSVELVSLSIFIS